MEASTKNPEELETNFSSFRCIPLHTNEQTLCRLLLAAWLLL